MGRRVRKGQVYRMKRTPRKGREALWEVVKKIFGGYVKLKCKETGEQKRIYRSTLLNHYDYELVEEGDYPQTDEELANELRDMAAGMFYDGQKEKEFLKSAANKIESLNEYVGELEQCINDLQDRLNTVVGKTGYHG